MLYLIICYIKHIKSILKLPKPKFHFKKGEKSDNYFK